MLIDEVNQSALERGREGGGREESTSWLLFNFSDKIYN